VEKSIAVFQTLVVEDPCCVKEDLFAVPHHVLSELADLLEDVFERFDFLSIDIELVL
jgi:hypothetical protein